MSKARAKYWGESGENVMKKSARLVTVGGRRVRRTFGLFPPQFSKCHGQQWPNRYWVEMNGQCFGDESKQPVGSTCLDEPRTLRAKSLQKMEGRER